MSRPMSGVTLSHAREGIALRTLLPLARPWYGKLGLLLLCVLLLTLSFAPRQPVLSRVDRDGAVAACPGRDAIADLGVLMELACRALFFTANMWWLAYVTGPGMLALMALLGLYWAVPAVIIRGAGLLLKPSAPADAPARNWEPSLHLARSSPLARIFLVAVVWVGLEWLRGTWPLQGLPWLYLGHTQSPLLCMCQVADIAGVFGISFWVMMLNVAVAIIAIEGGLRPFSCAGPAMLVCLAGILGYGYFRIGQMPSCTRPGPLVLVVQPNIPQSNNGSKGESLEEMLRFHLEKSRQALVENAGVDLVVWSETMMPPLNPGARELERLHGEPPFKWEIAHQKIGELSRQFHAAFLVGGLYYDDWKRGTDGWLPGDRRNSAYLYDAAGKLDDRRYDKIHLVPFGEFLPFKSAIPPLYRLFLSLSPYSEEYTLTAGRPDALTVFNLPLGGTPRDSSRRSASKTSIPPWSAECLPRTARGRWNKRGSPD